jgi:hypothetical protein
MQSETASPVSSRVPGSTPLPAAEATAMLQRFDFPLVKNLRREEHGWYGIAWRDGVWLAVEVLDDGTIIVHQTWDHAI